MMEHLAEGRIVEFVVDGAAWSPDEVKHLAGCNVCRETVAVYAALQDTLAVYERSDVSPEALARYDALFAHVERTPNRLVTLWSDIQAVLAWDGRTAAAGVRNAGGAGYRLLYSAAEHDIELMVEPHGTQRSVTGEVMLEQETTEPVLVELAAQSPAGSAPGVYDANLYSVESAADGRFRFDDVVPGRYILTATPMRGAPLVIDSLTIT